MTIAIQVPFDVKKAFGKKWERQRVKLLLPFHKRMGVRDPYPIIKRECKKLRDWAKWWYEMPLQQRLNEHLNIYIDDAKKDFRKGEEYNFYGELNKIRNLNRDGRTLEALALAWDLAEKHGPIFPLAFDTDRWEDIRFY